MKRREGGLEGGGAGGCSHHAASRPLAPRCCTIIWCFPLRSVAEKFTAVRNEVMDKGPAIPPHYGMGDEMKGHCSQTQPGC